MKHKLMCHSAKLLVFLAWLVCACGVKSQAAQPVKAKPNTPILNWEPRSDWTDVKKAGAVGDGVADDTAAIQKVLDGVKSGTTVYLPAGVYRITKSLLLKGPLIGVQVVGHGWATRLVWDGEEGGKLLVVDGVAHSRYIGFTLDGRGKSSIGIWHHNINRFETEVRHQHIAFLNFTQAGLATDNADRYALAETMFENCLFENCERGVSFRSFNDYNYTFAGCEFRNCGMGIDSSHGNFYARDCHFENSRTIDIIAASEHNSSVRRCTSVGSLAFLHTMSGVGAVVVQDCRVDSWKATDGAVKMQGAPVIMFDCVFTNPPQNSAPLNILSGGLRFISSCNEAPGSSSLYISKNGVIYDVPAGKRKGVLRSPQQRFLKEKVAIPGKVFDAKRDFGAKADGRTDDTQAVQKTIDAARAYGKGSIAYLPAGSYIVKETLQVTGKNYYVGGTGFECKLMWRGAPDSSMIEVKDAVNLSLENMAVGNSDVGPTASGNDILQTGSAKGSRVTYDGIFTFGMYQKRPFVKGLTFRKLGAKDVVLLTYVQGNMRFQDCGAATILGDCTYEGSVTVEGKDKDRSGFLGLMTRLATVVTHGLYVRDNQNFVASDFYIEQSDAGLVIEGSEGNPAGRVTIQGAKLDITPPKDKTERVIALGVRDYQGEIFFGPYQFYPGSPDLRILQQGKRPVKIFLSALSFYQVVPDLQKEDSAEVHSIGNLLTAPQHPQPYTADDVDMKAVLPQLSGGMDDLRRLGEVDLKLNYPDLK